MAYRQRLAKPLLYTTGAAVVGGGVIYYTYRPRNIPGLEPAAVPPPRYTEGGSWRPPRFPKVKTRDEQIADLKRSGGNAGTSGISGSLTSGLFGLQEAKAEPKSNEVYDLLVIGGGATGAGVALDAATRGLKVAMVEREDFSSGTSSKSTKL